MKKVNAIILGLVIFLAFSCSKDDDNVPEKEITCQLTKSISNQIINEYQYNAAGKLSRLNVIHPTPADNSHFEYVYGGNGLLEEVRYFDANNVLESREVFTFNQNNLPATVHYFWKNGSGALTANGFIVYQYNSGNQLLKSSFYPDLQATLPNHYSDFSYPGPDQVIEKLFVKDATGMALEYTYHYQFDDKINPLANQGYHVFLYMVSPHNLIDIQTTYHKSGKSSSQTTSYVYNDQGYPISYTYTSSDFPAASGSFEYNCQ